MSYILFHCIESYIYILNSSNSLTSEMSDIVIESFSILYIKYLLLDNIHAFTIKKGNRIIQ